MSTQDTVTPVSYRGWTIFNDGYNPDIEVEAHPGMIIFRAGRFRITMRPTLARELAETLSEAVETAELVNAGDLR